MIRVMRETVRSLLRGKLLWICFVCLLFSLGKYFFDAADSYDELIASPYGDISLHNGFYGWAYGPAGQSFIWLFAAVIAAVDVLRERKDGFSGLLRSAGQSTAKWLCGKAFAYLVLTMLAWAFFTYSEMAAYFIIVHGRLQITHYSFWEAFYKTTVRLLAMGIPTSLLYISLAVSAAALSGRSAVAIVAAVFFGNLKLFPRLILNINNLSLASKDIFTPFAYYFYPIPEVNVDFWYLRNVKDKTQYNPHQALSATDYALSLLLTFGTCALLLAAAYIKIRKAED